MFRKLTLFALILALCAVVMGAYVRISDAGLGCPDWPGCYGKVLVEPPAAELLAGRPFDAGKAWKEMAHRYLAGGLGVLILAMAGAVFAVRQNRKAAIALTFSLLGLVIVQALFGMWTVQLRLLPAVVTAHLFLGFLALALLYRLYLTVGPEIPPEGETKGLRWLARLGMLVLFAQVILGGWVSANYAALDCPDFPQCRGEWWPAAGYTEAFDVLRGLTTSDGRAAILSPEARIAVHWFHRLGAVVAFVVLSLLANAVTSNRKVPKLSKAGMLMSFLVLLQVSAGIALVLLRVPVIVAVVHNALGALLLLNLVHIQYRLRPVARQAVPEPRTGAIRETPSDVLAPPVPVPPTVPPVQVPQVPSQEGLFVRLKGQLSKTRGGLTGFLGGLALGKKAIDKDLLEEIESQLLMADIGVTATRDIIDHLTASLDRQQLKDASSLTAELRDYLYNILEPVSAPLTIPADKRPYVILVVGVNGVGKTTTIGKLAKRLQMAGHSVMLAAGDTFRAAAVEQLQTWGERNQVAVIAQHTGADSASVIYDGLQAAQARGVDVLIADTAGRLHTKSNLMDELSKIKRIMARLDPAAPHEVLLVLDAGTGQNAISQARLFNEAVGVTGLALTKLDGTAKGGVIFALAKQFGIPIRFIGIGETIDDLQDFEARKFIEALFDTE